MLQGREPLEMGQNWNIGEDLNDIGVFKGCENIPKDTFRFGKIIGNNKTDLFG